MNSRIRYIKTADHNVMQGNKHYRNNKDQEFTVEYTVHPENKSCAGVIIGAGEYIEMTATSAHKIKIALKKKLEELGCEFEKETRKKGE